VSTQINVTVDSGGLSAKAKQLQSAARQAQLERERTERVEAEAKAQRDAKLAAEGKAPDGSSLYGAPINKPEIDRRPAANRLLLGGLASVRIDQGAYTAPGFEAVNYFSISDAERKQVAFEEYNHPADANYALGGILLPSGKNSAVLVYRVRYGISEVLKAVVVGPTQARVVSAPSGLLEKVQHLQADLAYTENKWILGRQFGIHPTNLQVGAPQFEFRFTPAIYTLLSGAMDTETLTRLSSYTEMRSSYFNIAPRLYLRSDYENTDPILVKHKSTNVEPSTTSYVIPPQALRVNRSFDVRVNREGIDSSIGRPTAPSGGSISPRDPTTVVTHYFSWDWGKPTYCQGQLLALGFDPEDLTP